MKTYQLNDDVEIPALGFGTWQLKGDTALNSVNKALDVGYKHIDTADVYGNHKEVGQAIQDHTVAREDIFLTSKVWWKNLKKSEVKSNTKRFLDELQTDYLDLLLIHWPDSSTPAKEPLEAMNELRDEGLIRAVGVSNFTVNHLKDALDTGQEFSNNQVEFHPSLNQKKLKQFCDENGIVLTAYSPIAQGQDLSLDIIQELANKYDKPESQVILNWIIGKDMIAIPRSSNPDHIEENFNCTNWKLEQKDIKRIDNEVEETNNRIVDPSFGEFDY